MLPAPICGVFRPPNCAVGNGSEARDTTCGARLPWSVVRAYRSRACYHQFIHGSRLVFILAYSYVYHPRSIARGRVVPGNSPRQLRILPPCGSGHCCSGGCSCSCSSELYLAPPGDYRNCNPLRVNYYLMWPCRVALVVRHRRHISIMVDC